MTQIRPVVHGLAGNIVANFDEFPVQGNGVADADQFSVSSLGNPVDKKSVSFRALASSAVMICTALTRHENARQILAAVDHHPLATRVRVETATD